MSNLPIEGIRVIDLSRVIAGPLSASFLARMGADVIKIENPHHQDSLRNVIYTDGIEGTDRGGFYQIVNVGKKSCTLNLSSTEGIGLLKSLLNISDIVIENFRPKISEKLGLDYASLSDIKPDLIVASVLGFNRAGLERNYLAYGRNLHAAGGQTWLVGYPGGEPRGITGQWADFLAAMMLTNIILFCLDHKQKTGMGQHIDLSMTEAVSALLPEPILDYMMNGRDWKCMGNRSHFEAPHNCYPCKGYDSWIAIAISSDEEWKALCKAMGFPSWTNDERFTTALSRWQNQDDLDTLVSNWTRNYNDYEAMEILQKEGIKAGPTLNTQTMANDPHLTDRNFFKAIDHPFLGKRRIIGLPWHLDEKADENLTHAPTMGEHNNYVFGQLLGLSNDEINKLIKKKIVYQ